MSGSAPPWNESVTISSVASIAALQRPGGQLAQERRPLAHPFAFGKKLHQSCIDAAAPFGIANQLIYGSLVLLPQ